MGAPCTRQGQSHLLPPCAADGSVWLVCCRVKPHPKFLVPLLPCSIHPADPGHQVMAELLAGALSRAVWEATTGGALTEAEQRHDPSVPALPGPMIPFNADDMPGMCAMLVSCGMALFGCQAGSRPVSPPRSLLTGHRHTAACTGTAGRVAAPVVKQQQQQLQQGNASRVICITLRTLQPSSPLAAGGVQAGGEGPQRV